MPHSPFWKAVGNFWISCHLPTYCRGNTGFHCIHLVLSMRCICNNENSGKRAQYSPWWDQSWPEQRVWGICPTSKPERWLPGQTAESRKSPAESSSSGPAENKRENTQTISFTSGSHPSVSKTPFLRDSYRRKEQQRSTGMKR